VSTPDVRVRLSAEGVAEVVAALKKIQAESDAASRKGSAGWTKFNSVLSSTRSLLAGIGVAFGVGAIVNFIRQSAAAADRVDEIGQAASTTASRVSTLNFLASQTGLTLEDVGLILDRVNRRLGELGEGKSGARDFFRQLGLSAKDLKGRDSVAALDLIAARIAQIEDPARQTSAAIELLGRSGAKSLPFLRALADQGYARVEARARQLGVVIDDDLAARIAAANDELAVVSLQAQNIGASFAGGFAPQFAQATASITGNLEDQGRAWQEIGNTVGRVIKGVVVALSSMVDLGIQAMEQLADGFVATFRIFQRAASGDFVGAGQELFDFFSRAKVRAEELARRIEERFKIAGSEPPPPPGQPAPGTGDTPDPVELEKRRADAARSVLEKELAFQKAQAKARGEADKRAFDQGLIDLEEYFRRRRAAIEAGAAQEIAAINRRQLLLAQEPDDIKRAAEAQKLRLELAEAQLERESALSTLTLEQANAIRELGAKRLAIEEQVEAAEGRRHAAALRAIEEELRQAEIVFRQNGLADEERIARLDDLRRALTGAADFEEFSRQVDVAFGDLALARRAIEQDVRRGLLTAFEGEQKILELERERLPILDGIARRMLAIAVASGSPEQIQQARELLAALRELGVATGVSAVSFQNFKETLAASSFEQLTDFFARGITEAQNLETAVSDMARGILGSLRRLAAQALALSIFKALNIQVPGLSGGGRVGRARRLSGGGRVRGPGTPTSDSIPFRTMSGRHVLLSDTEFVVRGAVTAEPGALTFLETFNRYGMSIVNGSKPFAPRAIATAPGLAAGGMVGATQDLAQGRRDGRLTAVIGLEEGLVLRHMESPAGQRVTLTNLGRNRKSAELLLGGR
jgi:hypothetical protein